MSDFKHVVEELLLKTIKSYRHFMFPEECAQPGHDPYFSIDNSSDWITSRGLQLYYQYNEALDIPGLDPSDASRRDLIALRKEIIPDYLLTHQFFSLEHAETWVKPQVFSAYKRLLLPSQPVSDQDGRSDTDRRSLIVETQNEEGIEPDYDLPSRPPSSMYTGSVSDGDLPVLSDDEEIPFPESLIRPKSATSMSSILSTDSRPENDSAMPDEPPILNIDLQSRKAGKKKKMAEPLQPEEREGMIQITRELWVHELRSVDNIPDTWEVCRPDHSIAWLVDMSASTDLLLDEKGKRRMLQTYIRNEVRDQDSWGGKGSGGSLTGDVNVLAFPGTAKIRCRRAQWGCSGVRKCEFLDPSILANCKRYDVNTIEKESLWQLVLNANEREGESEWAVIARFFRFVTELKCKAKRGGIVCKGHLEMISSNSIFLNGKQAFIGCSGWSAHADNRKNHIFQKIPPHVNKDLLRYALDHGGLLPNSPEINGACCFTSHPRFRLLNCGYSHVVDGQIRIGKLETHPCPSEILVFTPVDPPANLADKTIVSLDRQMLNKAIDAAGLGGLTVQKLLNASSTHEIYQGQRVAEHSPAFQDHRLVREVISRKKAEKHPVGSGWEGVVHRYNTVDRGLPPSERYIHSVISKRNTRLATTMNALIARHAHKMRALMFDYAYKRIEGSINECEAVGYSESLSQCITIGSTYGDGVDALSYEEMFTEFWDAVQSSTGRILKLAPFYPDAKLKVIVLDGDIAQAQGFGAFLVRYNKPQISGITSTDPFKLISYCLKMCTVHFHRHINELPKSIPVSVIGRVKSIMTLKTPEDIVHWHSDMAAQTDPDLHNWYEHKRRNPLVLRAINQSLSNIPAEVWNTTPDNTNYVESAHATRNAETSTRLTPLRAVEAAEERDKLRAAELVQIEQEGIGRKRNNTLFNREKLALQRQSWKSRQETERREGLETLQSLQADLDAVRQGNKDSLERDRSIRDRIRAIQTDLDIDRRRQDLRVQIKALQDDLATELSLRRDLRLQKEDIDTRIKALRSTSLAGVQIRGRRPDSFSTLEAVEDGLGDIGGSLPADTLASTNNFPTSTDDFPVSTDDFPASFDDFPMSADDFPASFDDFP
ncbi:unnamed protein product, partial [Mycena citricolor]